MIDRQLLSRPTRVQQLSMLFSALVMLAACTSAPVRQISQAELVQRYDGFLNSYESELTAMEQASESRIRMERQGAAAGDIDRQSYDVLILSGGGAFGAFGAGFLAGWGEIEDREFARPEFDTVSGISTGALIAPFAFLGTPESYDDIVELYENPGQDWVQARPLRAMIRGDPSLFDVSGLHDRIREFVTPDLVRSMAVEAGNNRQLLVGATNVDYGQLRVWDLARVATTDDIETAVTQIAAVLQASTAIPGAFAPILIDNNLYVDGGAAMQVVSGIEDREWAYVPDTAAHDLLSETPIRVRIWIIVNQKLQSDPSVVDLNWASIMQRSASTLIRTSTLQSIRDAESYARILNQVPGMDATMRYVAIPQSFQIMESENLFDTNIMRELVKLGRSMGSDPGSWISESLRPGAPFRPTSTEAAGD